MKEVLIMDTFNYSPYENPNSLESIAYNEIRNAIITGTFPPGYQVVEDYISNQLNMSRSPVRSAIKRLQTEGFLEKRENKRMYVSMPSPAQIIDVLYIREALDGITARLAAANRTDSDVEKIQKVLQDSHKALSENNTYRQHELAIYLHHTIYDAAKNEPLARLAKNYENQVTLFTYNSYAQDNQRYAVSYKEHESICRCVIDQKPDEAEAAARFHIEQLRQRVLFIEQRRLISHSLSQLHP